MPDQITLPALNTLFLSYDATRYRGRCASVSEINAVGTPQINDLCFHTSLSKWCYCIAISPSIIWVTCEDLSFTFAEQTSAGAVAFAPKLPLRDDYGVYFTYSAIRARVATTNNGSNYWTALVETNDLQITTGTSIYLPTTAAGAANTQLKLDGVPTTNRPAGSNNAWVRLNCIPTGAPGSITVSATVFYRLVAS